MMELTRESLDALTDKAMEALDYYAGCSCDDCSLRAGAALLRDAILEAAPEPTRQKLWDALVEIDTYLANDPQVWRIVNVCKAGEVLCDILGPEVIGNINATVMENLCTKCGEAADGWDYARTTADQWREAYMKISALPEPEPTKGEK